MEKKAKTIIIKEGKTKSGGRPEKGGQQAGVTKSGGRPEKGGQQPGVTKSGGRPKSNKNGR